MRTRLIVWLLIMTSACAFYRRTARAAEPLLQLQGSELKGGAHSRFGASFFGRQVNYVYARPTGGASSMTAAWRLDRLPAEPVFLFLDARDDDAPAPCHVRIALNGCDLLRGPSGFPNDRWRIRRFELPSGALRVGANELSISNEEPRGDLGVPPWFMVSRLALADAEYRLPPVQLPSLRVSLPDEARPFPEPLRDGHSQPGFEFRGTKGWNWTPEQYLAEIPHLARLKMNFLMNCYLSMFSSGPGEPFKNEWWKPMSPARQAAYAQVIEACRAQQIIFCFAVHPQLGSPRPVDFSSPQDLEDFFQHYAWAQRQGVHWFSISLDDVSWDRGGPAGGGAAHARFVNTIFNRLRAKDPQAQMVFCPGPYWGDGTEPQARPYLETLGRDLRPDVYVFWTGDGVVTPRISRSAAQSYRGVVKHRLFLWDNYPVNDGSPTLHLGPVSGRDPDLCEVITGYMSNPLCPQNEINRLPLATCADYAFNPWAYDPARSIGQAILHLAVTGGQRQVLKDLVEVYPGFLVTGGGTGVNPVRNRFTSLLADPNLSGDARAFLERLQDLSRRLAQEFPTQFNAAKQTVAGDTQWMRQQLAGKP
jgi:hypothetical protein